MNCQYCQNEIKKVGSWFGDTTSEIHYHCLPCRTYFVYRQEKGIEEKVLHEISIYTTTSRGNFYFSMFVLNNTAELFSYEPGKIENGELVFALSHIPDWTPSNLAKKIDNLLIFS